MNWKIRTRLELRRIFESMSVYSVLTLSENIIETEKLNPIKIPLDERESKIHVFSIKRVFDQNFHFLR